LINDYNKRNSANIVRIEKKANNHFKTTKNQFLGKRDKRNIFDEFDENKNEDDDLLL